VVVAGASGVGVAFAGVSLYKRFKNRRHTSKRMPRIIEIGALSGPRKPRSPSYSRYIRGCALQTGGCAYPSANDEDFEHVRLPQYCQAISFWGHWRGCDDIYAGWGEAGTN